MLVLDERNLAIQYARCFLGTPYCWGGESPVLAFLDGVQVGGFDCSGFVRWVLKPSGKIPLRGDQSSQMLYNMFQNKQIDSKFMQAGCLAFYGKSKTKITHIAMIVNSKRIIECGGGGSSCKTVEKAFQLNACVRELPFGHRRDLVAICDPFN